MSVTASTTKCLSIKGARKPWNCACYSRWGGETGKTGPGRSATMIPRKQAGKGLTVIWRREAKEEEERKKKGRGGSESSKHRSPHSQLIHSRLEGAALDKVSVLPRCLVNEHQGERKRPNPVFASTPPLLFFVFLSFKADIMSYPSLGQELDLQTGKHEQINERK